MKTLLEQQQAQGLLGTISRATRLPKAQVKTVVQAAETRLRERERAALSVTAPLVAPPAPQVPVPPSAPREAVTVRLASGRTVRVRIAPGLATQQELDALKRNASENLRRNRKNLRQHAKAINKLAASHTAMERRLEALQRQADLALIGNLKGLAGLGSQVAKSQDQLLAQGRALSNAKGSHGQALALQAGRARAQQWNNALSSMQMTAYGEKGDALGKNNLLLGGNQLLWSAIDPILRRFNLWSGADVSLLSWIGPIVAFGVVQATLAKDANMRQARYLQGEVAVVLPPWVYGEGVRDESALVSVDLQPYVIPSYWPAFKQRPVVPATVTATVLDGTQTGREQIEVVGNVELGLLVIRVWGPYNARVRVTWTVDTGVGHV